MITIGFRAAPTAVAFVVFDSNERKVVNSENIRVPEAFSIPERLKYIRSNVLDILREYDVERAGIRITESSAQVKDSMRLQIEGVIQEAFASSKVTGYYAGQISSISAKIGIERADFKPYIKGEKDYPVEAWDEMSSEEREATLCAIGAVNA